MTTQNEETGVSYIALMSIIEAVCEVFDVSKEELFCKSRPLRLSYPRFATYYLGWLHTKRSIANIGRFMDRDHTTILYGRDKAIRLRKENAEFAEKLEAAKELAFEIELRKEMAAKQEMAEIQRKLKEEQEREEQARRKLEEARLSLPKKGVLRGDKVVFSRINSYG